MRGPSNNAGAAPRKRRRQFSGRGKQTGRHNEFPIRHRLGRRGDDIQESTQAAQPAIKGEHEFEIGKILTLRLNAPGPGAFIIENESDGRPLVSRAGWERRKFPRNLRDDVVGGVGLGIWQQQPFMHLLLREGRLAPTKIAYDFRPGGEGFMGPEPHRARRRRRDSMRPSSPRPAVAPSPTSVRARKRDRDRDETPGNPGLRLASGVS